MDLCLRKRLLIEKPDHPPKNSLWFHCASVGEFNTALPLIKELKKEHSVVLTYFSPRAKEYLERKGDLYDLLFPLPVDIPFLVRKFERIVQPKALIIVERELWFSLLKFTKVKKILLNAYSKGGIRERLLIREFDLVIARTEEDRRRFEEEGARKVVACGNLKVVQDVEDIHPPALPEEWRVMVAGSTREGEEEVVLKAFLKLREEFPLKLVLAPRHVKRADDVVRTARSTGLKVSKRSEEEKDWDILVLDTLGELKGFYHKADVAFVGGTIAEVGGHNLLEPAVFGKPVLFGPNTWKVKDLEEILLEKDYGFRVEGPEDIVRVARRILSEGFRPGESFEEFSGKVKECYLKNLRLELEEIA